MNNKEKYFLVKQANLEYTATRDALEHADNLKRWDALEGESPYHDSGLAKDVASMDEIKAVNYYANNPGTISNFSRELGDHHERKKFKPSLTTYDESSERGWSDNINWDIVAPTLTLAGLASLPLAIAYRKRQDAKKNEKKKDE